MKKIIFTIIILAISGCLVGWIWFIEFGGWDFLLEKSRHNPKMHRLTILLDHPMVYYQWRASLKIFDPLYLGYWHRPKGLKIYNLIITNADFQKMSAYLPEGYTSGGLSREKRVKASGELMIDGAAQTVKVSYHGDTYNHWSSEKKSWKIEFNTGEEQYLIIPSDRGYFSESLSNYRAKNWVY